MRPATVGLFVVVILTYITRAQGAGCNAWTGASNAASLNTDEHLPTSDTGLAVAVTSYQTTCTCGIVTSWRIFSRKNGTIILYVRSGSTNIGSTTVTIPPLSADNFFEIPLSRDMWVSVGPSNPHLAFYTAGPPMLTWGTGTITSTYSTGGTVTFTGATNTDREYAIGAYIETGHQPVFLNLPYTATLYSHNTGVILTVQATDIDPADASSLTYSATSINTAYFSFNTGTQVLTYHTQYTAASAQIFTIQITASDGCNTAQSQAATITIVNEPPRFQNLPFSTTVNEHTTTAFTYTIQTYDPSGDTVTCSLDNVNPADSSSIFSVVSNEIRQKANPGFNYDTAKYYDLRIRCSDVSVNAIYANYMFDIVMNEPPAYNAGSGYLPASVAVSSASGQNIYTLDATDPEGDTITFSIACSGTCPFSISGTVISTNAELTAEGYDIFVTMVDAYNVVGPYTLSVLVSVNPRSSAVNSAPIYNNLPTTTATLYVPENMAAGTYLYKLMHRDANPTNTFTFTKTVDNTLSFFAFDASTQIITTAQVIDFENAYSGGSRRFDVEVDDGTSTATYTVRCNIVDINETPTLTATTPTITRDEGAKDSVFPAPGFTFTDEDAADTATTATWSMTCGNDSKYFYINNADRLIYLAREYDMDSGLPGNATCVVTATDTGGLSASVTLTLSVSNINDNTPRFPHNVYAFVLPQTATFFTQITNLSAYDGDSDSSGVSGGLSYNFGPAFTGFSAYFQIDAVGVLYVRDFSSLAEGSVHVFEMTATDSGTNPSALTGTCTLTIILSAVAVVTTTTTERSYVFTDDYLNPVWVLLVALLLFAVVVVTVFIIWNDPKFNEWKTFKMFRLSEICMTKPKEPKRSTVHPAKLTVTVNNKTLVSDPDNAMPWELLAKDANVPEINEVQERIQQRKEKQDREYVKAGLPVFEKGKGARPPSAGSRQDSDSPKYATMSGQGNGGSGGSDKGSIGNNGMDDDEGGESQWGNLQDRRVIRHSSPTVVTPVDMENSMPGSAYSGMRRGNNSRSQHPALRQLTDF